MDHNKFELHHLPGTISYLILMEYFLFSDIGEYSDSLVEILMSEIELGSSSSTLLSVT